MRLDVDAGRGAGSTAILANGRVYGFKRGLLSLFRRSFDPANPRVRSLRGTSMEDNGFLDDLKYVLTIRGEVVTETLGSETVVLRYRNALGLVTKMVLGKNPLRVVEHEVFEGDDVVERYSYADVRYNPVIDPSRLRP